MEENKTNENNTNATKKRRHKGSGPTRLIKVTTPTGKQFDHYKKLINIEDNTEALTTLIENSKEMKAYKQLLTQNQTEE